MNPHNHAAMLEALRRKKAHGVDLTIVMGHPGDGHNSLQGNQEDPHAMAGEGDGKDGDEDQKALGLAPEAEEISESEGEKERELAEEGHQGNHVPGEEIINHPPAPGEEGRGLMAGHLSGHGMSKHSMHARMMKKKEHMGGKY